MSYLHSGVRNFLLASLKDMEESEYFLPSYELHYLNGASLKYVELVFRSIFFLLTSKLWPPIIHSYYEGKVKNLNVAKYKENKML